MQSNAQRADSFAADPVSNVLKWALLAVAVISFGLFAWATVATYERAPPQPERFVGPGGVVVMTSQDILAGKGGFQKSDMMDYGSLYGMGSYYGDDYTAQTLVELGLAARAGIAQAADGKSFTGLDPDQQAAATAAMRRSLQGIDLTQRQVAFSAPLAAAVIS
ncbi:MAG: hypothetical protein ACREEX_05140, partial [Caulobacteraceae bacterium]